MRCKTHDISCFIAKSGDAIFVPFFGGMPPKKGRKIFFPFLPILGGRG
jgi:hypothetical protein